MYTWPFFVCYFFQGQTFSASRVRSYLIHIIIIILGGYVAIDSKYYDRFSPPIKSLIFDMFQRSHDNITINSTSEIHTYRIINTIQHTIRLVKYFAYIFSVFNLFIL